MTNLPDIVERLNAMQRRALLEAEPSIRSIFGASLFVRGNAAKCLEGTGLTFITVGGVLLTETGMAARQALSPKQGGDREQ